MAQTGDAGRVGAGELGSLFGVLYPLPRAGPPPTSDITMCFLLYYISTPTPVHLWKPSPHPTPPLTPPPSTSECDVGR